MKPILFNTEMVRAILEGKKTVTRRAVKFPRGWNPKFTGYIPDGAVLYGSNNIPAAKSPYKTGDILWVRETWSISDGSYLYRAWPGEGMEPENQDWAMREMGLKWRPSIHMPREAARIFLRVTDVRVERLREITPQQIDAEGCCEYAYDAKTGKPAPSGPSWFKIQWGKTIKPAEQGTYGWDANPWVWVIEFERISREEAAHDE